SRLGADPFGAYVRAGLEAAGVDCSLVGTDDSAPTGVYFKDPAPTGTTVHYYRRGSAASTMDRTLWTDVAAAGAAYVHLSGITPVVKDGAVGATGYDGDGRVFVPASPVEIVEPVGAGDAFAAGYLLAALQGRGLASRLAVGHRLAAVALGAVADVGVVPATEVLLA